MNILSLPTPNQDALTLFQIYDYFRDCWEALTGSNMCNIFSSINADAAIYLLVGVNNVLIKRGFRRAYLTHTHTQAKVEISHRHSDDKI